MDFVLCALTCAAACLQGADCKPAGYWTYGEREPIPIIQRRIEVLLHGPKCYDLGYLCYAHEVCGEVRRHVEPYDPQEGDLVFFNSQQRFWEIMYKLVGSSMPDHLGLVVRRSDGCLAVLESGPDNIPWVFTVDAVPRLHQYSGSVMVRRIKRPLTPEESCRLTEWSEAQLGKRYPIWRLIIQTTPFRAKGPLREKCFGKTDLHRTQFLCAEICIVACAAAGLMDPCVFKANSIYPYDVVDNHRYDMSYLWEDAAVWTPNPPHSGEPCLVFPKSSRASSR